MDRAIRAASHDLSDLPAALAEEGVVFQDRDKAMEGIGRMLDDIKHHRLDVFWSDDLLAYALGWPTPTASREHLQ